MQIIGLTGGIAAGKSTVAAMLQAAGIPVVNADEIARDVLAIGTPGLQQVISHFGEAYRLDDGSLDRNKLGQLVFHDPIKRKELEAITHPLIAEVVLKHMNTLESEGHKVAVYEAPLLFETQTYKRFNGTILVDVPPEIQLERLIKRNGLTPEEAQARINSQLSRNQKIALADGVLDNSQSVEHTAFLLRQIWHRLTGQDIAFTKVA